MPPVSAVASHPPPPPKRSLRGVVLFASAAIVLGLGASWGLSAMRRAKVVEVPMHRLGTKAAAPASAANIDLGEVPVSGPGDAQAGDDMSTCVSSYLPKGAFAGAQKLDFICDESDPREGASKLKTAIVKGAAPGTTTDAMKLYSKLGWYELALFATLQNGCCGEAKAPALPEPSAGCDAMAGALKDLATAVVAERDSASALDKLAAAAACEAKAGKAAAFRRSAAPTDAEKAAFSELVAAARAK